MRRMRDGTDLYIDSARRFYASFNDDGTVRLFNRRGCDQHGRWMPLATRWELRQKGLTAIGISGPIEWLLWLQHRLGGPELDASAKTAFMARTAEVRTRVRIAWTLRLLDDRRPPARPRARATTRSAGCRRGGRRRRAARTRSRGTSPGSRRSSRRCRRAPRPGSVRRRRSRPPA